MIVMDGGYASQIGSPIEVYRKPATKFVAGFIGAPPMNFLDVQLDSEGSHALLPGKEALSLETPLADYAGKAVTLGIRPEHIHVHEESDEAQHLNVDYVETLGADTLIHGHFGEDQTKLTIRLQDIHFLETGQRIPISIPSNRIHLFDPQTELRIGD